LALLFLVFDGLVFQIVSLNSTNFFLRLFRIIILSTLSNYFFPIATNIGFLGIDLKLTFVLKMCFSTYKIFLCTSWVYLTTMGIPQIQFFISKVFLPISNLFIGLNVWFFQWMWLFRVCFATLHLFSCTFLRIPHGVVPVQHAETLNLFGVF